MLTHVQVLAYIYITVNFQLRISINAGLTERSLYNRFCIERSAKIGFWGEGLRYLVGSPLGMQWPPIYVVWWWNCGDALNILVHTRGKVLAKNGMSTPWGLHFTPVLFLPPKPLVTPWCMWGLVGDIITHAQFQLNRFRGSWTTVTPKSLSHTRTVVRECCKGDDASQWRNPKFDSHRAQTP